MLVIFACHNNNGFCLSYKNIKSIQIVKVMMEVINHSNHTGCRGSIVLRAFDKLNQVTLIVFFI